MRERESARARERERENARERNCFALQPVQVHLEVTDREVSPPPLSGLTDYGPVFQVISQMNDREGAPPPSAPSSSFLLLSSPELSDATVYEP